MTNTDTFPKLIGSEKQIRWAETLRQTRIAQIEAGIQGMRDENMGRRRHGQPGETYPLAEAIAAEALDILRERITSATLLIEMRGYRLYTLISNYYSGYGTSSVDIYNADAQRWISPEYKEMAVMIEQAAW